MLQTDKKKYIQPDICIVELESASLLTGSDEFPEYNGSLGAKSRDLDFDVEE
ncbi:MAG: hypothetical protein KBT29_00250 [Prevotellaceae bacterium]|nr:hypothetical protein [Candidatus Minthosoma caballi]